MPQATGALTKLLGVTQSALKAVPASPDAEILYVRTYDYDADQPLESDPTLAGGLRGEQRGERGRVDGSGSAVLTLGTSIGFWLKHLVGAPTTVGAASPYTHTFQVGNGANAIPPAMLIEADYSSRIATPGRYDRDMDIRVESATFAFSTGSAFQQATFNLRGASLSTQPGAPVDASPTDYGHVGWGVSGVTLELDGGATQVCVETLNVTWNNDLDTDLYCLNDGGQRHDLPEGRAIVTGDGVAQFDSPVLRAKALAGTDLALKVTLKRGSGAGTVGNEQLELTIPVSVIKAPKPPISGPRGLKQNFTFQAYRATGAELAVTWVLKSPRAAI
jgi:hypothetical protein